jgi:hypothetical protein
MAETVDEDGSDAGDGSLGELLETVTPSPSALPGSTPAGVDSPTVQLGVRHKDNSDDESEPAVAATSGPASKRTFFPKTSFTIDPSNYNESDLPSTNIILPLSKLIKFMDESFKCRKCHSALKKQFVIEKYGIATSIYFKCLGCDQHQACRADLEEDLEEAWEKKPEATKFKDHKKDQVNGAKFEINKKIHLATQLCGGGMMETRVMSGLLGLHTNPLRGRWQEIATTIGLKIIELTEEIIEQNVAIEMAMSADDPLTGFKQMSCCGDCRWDKRSSGRRYDSCSGCPVLMGCRSQLVIGVEPMSNLCSKCTRDIPHDVTFAQGTLTVPPKRWRRLVPTK